MFVYLKACLCDLWADILVSVRQTWLSSSCTAFMICYCLCFNEWMKCMSVSHQTILLFQATRSILVRCISVMVSSGPLLQCCWAGERKGIRPIKISHQQHPKGIGLTWKDRLPVELKPEMVLIVHSGISVSSSISKLTSRVNSWLWFVIDKCFIYRVSKMSLFLNSYNLKKLLSTNFFLLLP